MRICLLVLAICFLMASCGEDQGKDGVLPQSGTPAAAAEAIGYMVMGQQPHDTSAFTEGFVFHDGKLYESTAYVPEVPASRSWFGPVDSLTGRIKPVVELNKDQYFGEGICFLKDRVYQLTYREKLGFIYDSRTFKKLGEFNMPGKEGWGMTTDGRQLLVSDGTSFIYCLDPSGMQTTRKIQVTDAGAAVDSVNELEYIHGYIYANRYTKDFIMKVDPATGKVVGKIDLSNLVATARQVYPALKELNGIAYDSTTDRILVTGKCWPKIYTLQFPH